MAPILGDYDTNYYNPLYHPEVPTMVPKRSIIRDKLQGSGGHEGKVRSGPNWDVSESFLEGYRGI